MTAHWKLAALEVVFYLGSARLTMHASGWGVCEGEWRRSLLYVAPNEDEKGVQKSKCEQEGKVHVYCLGYGKVKPPKSHNILSHYTI